MAVHIHLQEHTRADEAASAIFFPNLGDAVRVYGPKAPKVWLGREGLDRWRPRWT